MEQMDIAVKIENVKKEYRLGTIGGGTLQGDIQSWWARKRGKEDPNSLVGSKYHKKNETFMALDGINLTIYKGERVGIIGHNGAGKSTLLKLLSRVTAPTDGKIYINGRIASMLEVGTGFNPELTGRENIYLNGAILGMTRDEVDRKIEKIIDFSECRQFIDTPVKRYSSGMYVKLAFSVAAHLDSEILVMDEVLAVGDMKFQQKCLGKMSDVSQDEGRTVLYVSHNMNTIRQLCERCIVLDHGLIIYDGNVEEAIAIYMEQEQFNHTVFYDFDKVERDKHELGEQARLISFTFLDKDEPLFERNSILKFCLKWENKVQNNKYRILIPIKSGSGNIVGSALSDWLEKSDETFTLDLTGLIPGKYTFVIALYAVNEFGTELLCDHSVIRMAFEIYEKETNDFEWKSQWWGNLQMKLNKE